MSPQDTSWMQRHTRPGTWGRRFADWMARVFDALEGRR